MKQYLELINEVLINGIPKTDRTGIGTISTFGTQKKYNLANGFPLVTTKKIHWKSVVYELLWFIQGDTNIKYLVEHDVRIWNEWPYQKYKSSSSYLGESIEEFVEKIKQNDSFSKKWGDLGPVYGEQWRNFNGVDQLANIVNQLKTNKSSRRIILSSWNPAQVENMALPPCHTLIQFYVSDKRLSCQLYQRSADVFLGVPFNIASYALLTHMLAQISGLSVGEFVHTTGDTHIYKNHINQVNEQINRTPKKPPTLKLNQSIKKIEDFKFEDIELINYEYHPLIKGKVAV